LANQRMEQGENQTVSMTFHAGPTPPGYRLDYEPYLFNTKEHRALQAREGWEEFHLLSETSKKIVASVSFHVKDSVAKSPFRAPFGGFEYGKEVNVEPIFSFIADVERALIKKGVREIEILCPPELYSLNQPFLTISLLNQGYQIILAEPGACIEVDKISLAEKMSKDKRARLRQCEKLGLAFKKLDLKNLETAYSFIANCREKQGRQLSMSFCNLLKTVQTLPKSFFIVGVFDQKKMIGACICVRVSPSIVYTFYSAHDDSYDKISPRVFLLDNLYRFCQKNKVELLDLGTSALDSKPNFPLLDFKLRVGATLTQKFKFKKTLA
jgi:hypothetical protein